MSHPCDAELCSSTAVLQEGECDICDLHMCKVHLTPKFHKCQELSMREKDAIWSETRERENQKLLAAVQKIDIAVAVERIRPGHKAILLIPTAGDNKMCGGINTHMIVQFDEGTEWLARIRHFSVRSKPKDAETVHLVSEVETFKFVKTLMKDKIPSVWMPPLVNPEGQTGHLSYFFVEKMPGHSASAPLSQQGEVTKVQNTIQDFAQLSSRITDTSFDKIGSLYPSPTGSAVGPMLVSEMAVIDPPYGLGPFATSQERYLAFIDLILHQIAAEQRFTLDPISAYLWHLEMRGLVLGSPGLARREEAFYIKHGDDKGDHFLVDDDGHITAIIDWEMSWVTTKIEAFSGPFGLLYHEEFFASNALTGDEAFLASSYDELGRSDLATCVRSPLAKVHQRLNYSIGKNLGHRYFDMSDRALLLLAFQDEAIGLRENGKVSPLPQQIETKDEWIQAMKAKFAEDEGLKQLLIRSAKEE